MRVIEHGTTYHEIQCPKCKARLGYTTKEVMTHEDQSPFGDDWSTEKYVECPECGKHITLRLVINGKVEKDGMDILRYNTGEYSSGVLC